MPNIILGSGQLSGGYEIDNSLRFDDGSGDNLSASSFGTPTSATTYTLSWWIKKASNGEVSYLFGWYDGSRTNSGDILFDSNDNLAMYHGSNDGNGKLLQPTQKFRDQSAWYHMVWSVDTTQSTASNRIKFYVNGTQVTDFSSATYPDQNAESKIFHDTNNRIGSQWNGTTSTALNGYLAEVVFIDGQQLDPTSFGEFDADTGIWKPINVSGLTFGTNGFYLDYENSGSLGADVSGNGNNFTVNNLTSIDQTTDTPTNNFATLNALIPDGSVTLVEGNLKVSAIGDNDWRSGTFGGSFKWYAECKINVAYDGSGGGICIGAISEDGLTENNGGSFSGLSNANVKFYTNSNDGKFQEGGGNNISGEDGFTRASTNDIVGVACDGANGRIYIHVNGTYLNSGDPVGGTGFIGGTAGYQGIWFPWNGSHLTKGQGSWNFGNSPFTISSGNSDANGYGNFEYAVPSGYYALNTKNLAEYG
jgi:hypothetical protein